MRILYFSRDYSSHDHRFLSALVKSGQEVFYLRLERRGHTLEDRPLPAGVTQKQWVGGQEPFHFANLPRLLLDLKRVIREVKPDLIQAGPLQTAALLVALSGFQPLVSMSWGYDLLIDAEKSPAWRQATAFALQHSAVMVGDCDTIRQKAISYGMRPDRIVTFPWGVDLTHFHPEPIELSNPDVFTLLSTRGWEPIYGIELIAQGFVQATRRLAELTGAGSLPALRLLMLGNGSLAPKIHSIFSQAGLVNQVHFAGQVGFDRLPGYYRAADLYLSASHSDGSSISLLEAMACGRPALVSDIPGNREWVTPDVNGWWFPDGDSKALAEAIVHAVCERGRLVEMGQAARQIAEQRADWEKNFPELLKAYQLAFHRPIV